MTNPLTTTRPIACALRDASDPAMRESFTVPLWENLLMEHLIRPNRELALNSQQPVDETLKKVDLMVRYYSATGEATALFLLECKRNKQNKYNLQQLEEQLNDYTRFLFLKDGVPRNPLVVYGGVAFGSLVRMFRIAEQKSSSAKTYINVTPIWGGQPYDIKCYKDVSKIEDAHQILQVFHEIASLANYSFGTTSTGNANRLPKLSTLSENSSSLLPKMTTRGIMMSNQPQSIVGPSFRPTYENLVTLEKHMEVNGNAYYSWTMANGDNLRESVVSSGWKEVTPAGGAPYFRHSTNNVWSRGCKEQSDQVIEDEAEEDEAEEDEVEEDEVEEDEVEEDEAEEEEYFKPTLANEVNLGRVTSLAGKFYEWKRGKKTVKERIKNSDWEKVQVPKGDAYYRSLKYRVWSRTCK